MLQVGFPASAGFNKRKAEAGDARTKVADAVKTIVGERLTRLRLLEGEESEDDEELSATSSSSSSRARSTPRSRVEHGIRQRGGSRMTRPRGGPGGLDLNAMMKQVQQMQADMADAQEKLKDETVDASAGGGMVKVKMSGDLRLLELTIDPGDRPRGRSSFRTWC